jgi:hypothetical protein
VANSRADTRQGSIRGIDGRGREISKRLVVAPGRGAGTASGEVLSVEVGADEDIEWIWSHDPEHGSVVTGYRIVPRATRS